MRRVGRAHQRRPPAGRARASLPAAPALANAVYQACGAEFFSNVLKPEKVLKAIKEKEKKDKESAKPKATSKAKGK